GVFQRFTNLFQPLSAAAFRTDRREFEECGYGLAILEQHATRLQKLDPWQKLHEGRTRLVERLFFAHRAHTVSVGTPARRQWNPVSLHSGSVSLPRVRCGIRGGHQKSSVRSTGMAYCTR